MDRHPNPGGAVPRVVSVLICLTIPYLHARADEIRGFVTIGMKRVFEEVRPGFETASGRRLNVQFASSPDIAKRVQEGEAADFTIISRTAADGLVNSGIVPASNRFVLGGSSIVVAVPAGRPKPDVSTPERLRTRREISDPPTPRFQAMLRHNFHWTKPLRGNSVI
jgi:molybdate transport system substrate-binding protein